MRSRRVTNPFYALLIVVGTAFTVTAIAYFVLALRGSPTPGTPAETQGPLMTLLDEHGAQAMAVELGLLALFTVCAISTDSWWAPAPPPAGPQRPRSTPDEPPT